MVSRRRALALVLLALAAGGCASLSSSPSTATLNAGVPTADELAAPYRAQAVDLERTGQLRQAAEAWTTALALAPDHESSRQALKRLRERIDRELNEHLKEGWHALARDNAPDARRHFLAALALDPDSRAAQQALRATPAPPAIAADPKPAEPVARPVSLTPKPRVESSAPARPSVAPGPRPGGEEGKKPDALYASAKAHLAEHRDEDAYRVLTLLSSASPGYKDSATLLRNVRARLVQQRYQEGLRLLREEQLEAAIEQWRGVLELDPKHANARRNIEQAERMLRTLAAQPKQ